MIQKRAKKFTLHSLLPCNSLSETKSIENSTAVSANNANRKSEKRVQLQPDESITMKEMSNSEEKSDIKPLELSPKFSLLCETWNTSKEYPLRLIVSREDFLDIIQCITVEENSWDLLIQKLAPHRNNQHFWNLVIRASETVSPDVPVYDKRLHDVSIPKVGKFKEHLHLFRWIKGKYVDEGLIWDAEHPFYACEYFDIGHAHEHSEHSS